MARTDIEQTIDAAAAKREAPCQHDFRDGVCARCYCPESPQYAAKAYELACRQEQ